MLTLQQLAEQAGAQYIGEDMPLAPTAFDSRQVKPGDWFVALKGERVDGHDFLHQVIQAGAAAVLVREPIDADICQIIAPDTLQTFGDMAKLWREQFSIPVIGLTGSCGKTTTKDMLASILEQCGNVLYTTGSFNSQVTLPHMVLQLRPQHQFAVFEMGISQGGEMERLVAIAQPTVSLITNISLQHGEGLRSEANIAAEKSHIYQALGKSGIGIINADEPYAKQWHDMLDKRHCLTFARHNKADITLKHCHLGPDCVEFDLITPIGEQAIAIPLPGEHMATNALAATAAAMAVGADLKAVAKGLALVKAQRGRFASTILENGTIVVDDSYNASPKSVQAALSSLAQHSGQRIFVMSNMAELGDQAAQIHQDMGMWINQAQPHHVLLFGDRALLDNTLKTCPTAQYYQTKTDLVNALLPLLDATTMVVIKGCRSHCMEEIVADITEKRALQPVEVDA